MELSIEIILLLIFLGFLAGTASVIAGVGGGVFFVSIMTLIFLIPINEAIDTSIFIILISSFAGFLSYIRQKRTHIKLAIIFGVFSILGSIFASILFSFVPINNTILKILFASVLLIAGLNMIYKAITSRNDEDSDKLIENGFNLEEHNYKENLMKSIPLFILAGFTANLLGIGGGIINTPSLHIVLQYPIHNSTAISTSIIFFTAIYNTIVKSCYGQINYLFGILIGIGAILGSVFGAKISNKISRNQLQFIVAIILLGLAIRMYF
ncbi:MAG: sulfite exporter TauE/SafE family protein [Promethearchaeota archaeon]